VVELCKKEVYELKASLSEEGCKMQRSREQSKVIYRVCIYSTSNLCPLNSKKEKLREKGGGIDRRGFSTR
jgi:hypothetical protein